MKEDWKQFGRTYFPRKCPFAKVFHASIFTNLPLRKLDIRIVFLVNGGDNGNIKSRKWKKAENSLAGIIPRAGILPQRHSAKVFDKIAFTSVGNIIAII